MFKGEPNKKGRPKGSPNKSTKDIREAVQKIVEGNIGQIEDDLSSLEPKDRIKFIIDFMGYVLPRLKTTEISAIQENEGMKTIEISFID